MDGWEMETLGDQEYMVRPNGELITGNSGPKIEFEENSYKNQSVVLCYQTAVNGDLDECIYPIVKIYDEYDELISDQYPIYGTDYYQVPEGVEFVVISGGKCWVRKLGSFCVEKFCDDDSKFDVYEQIAKMDSDEQIMDFIRGLIEKLKKE